MLEVLVAMVAGAALSAYGLRGAREATRRARVLRGAGDVSPSDALAGLAGTSVVLEGTLMEGAASTRFTGATRGSEVPEPSATTSSFPEHLRLQVGETVVALGAPLQVVLGSRELRARSVGSHRSLQGGDRVRAAGVLVPTAGDEAATAKGYRSAAVRYELRAEPSSPIALYAVGAGPRLGVAVACLAAGLAIGAPAGFAARDLVGPRHHAGEATSTASPWPWVRPSCGSDVDRLVDTWETERARSLALSCGDHLGAAEAAWLMGDVQNASASYHALRAAGGSPRTAFGREAARAVGVAEVEAAELAAADSIHTRTLLERARGDWTGAGMPSRDAIDCVLHTAGEMCLAAPARAIWNARVQGVLPDAVSPDDALREPERFVRFTPLDDDGARWKWGRDARNRALGAQATRVGQANVRAVRMLHDAITGEAAEYAVEARELRGLAGMMPSLAEAPAGTRGTDGLEDAERAALRADARRDLAVAATAAWLNGDDLATVNDLLAGGELHAKGILEEHLRLAAGTQKAPDPAHLPDDYTEGEAALFADAATLRPDQLAEEIVRADATSPALLTALLASRPAQRAAFAAEVKAGFPKPCRSCGTYALLRTLYRRRVASRLAGLADAEADALAASRRLGAALRAGAASDADGANGTMTVLEIESLRDP